jgi:hypothetical protein
LIGGGGGIGRSGCFFPPTPVLVARANNNEDKDGCIIVKERWEKDHRASATRRWKVCLLVAVGHGRQWWRGIRYLGKRIIGVHGLGP